VYRLNLLDTQQSIFLSFYKEGSYYTQTHPPNMNLKSLLLFILLLILLVSLPGVSFANDYEARNSDTLTLYLENDVLQNTDRWYTNGMKISWISRDLSNYRDIISWPWLYRLIEKLPWVNDPDEQRNISVSLGQNIYTPEDKERSSLIINDRPYAGITYLAFGLHSKNNRIMDTLELDIGMVGPHSYAENVQKEVHRWTSSSQPQGWEHQLHDEPIVNLYFERKWKLLQFGNHQGFGMDLIPHMGMALGNAYTAANAGCQMRLGWNLPNDFGTFLIRPGSDSNAPVDDTDPRFSEHFHHLGIHTFFAFDGNAVLHNIFLDGNTFRDSHSVDKEPWVANFISGVGMIVYRVKITLSYVYRTKEFSKQREAQEFSAIAASFTF